MTDNIPRLWSHYNRVKQPVEAIRAYKGLKIPRPTRPKSSKKERY